ncbi:hypothetical protein FVR03_20560 [Pontibacter qinzhouensis]|uniref:Uncharacterized protein n=1 Tax=Pontibacter qinzhouensis TaxID=2603253 RepID=A0A5C8J3W9_9BACT|nr:hypothetical protein [Pontibacter qinzhouensis]TXK29663.1 hypothetical protein FVR03_20560 [Pontibacter qinzhouensis]
MRTIPKLFLLLIFQILTGCVGEPPTEHARQLLQQVENHRQEKGLYPTTLPGNLTDGERSGIKAEYFIYIVDSTRTSFTLKVFIGNGLADIYKSGTGKWIRTDK